MHRTWFFTNVIRNLGKTSMGTLPNSPLSTMRMAL